MMLLVVNPIVFLRQISNRIILMLLRKTFIFNAEGVLERIIEKVDTKNHAAQIL